jgi:HlyD family secretion protein
VRKGEAVATVAPVSPSPLDARSRAEAEAGVATARAALGGARAQRERAQAALALAQSELTRHRELAEQQVVSRQLLEAKETEASASAEGARAAEFAVARAEHELEMAQACLLQAGGGASPGRAIELRSPIDGVVLKRLRESEGVVAAGTPLLEVGDPQRLEIVSDLLSTDAVKVPPGAPVLLEQWGGEKPLRARVRRVEPSGFMKISALGVEEQRVNVVMDFEDPLEAWAALGDGYRVEVRIVIWQGQDVVKIPVSSLFRRGDDWTVFAVDGGRARLRGLEVGRRNGVEAEVRSGLREGETVVLHPSDTLKDGDRVMRRAS